MTTPLRALTPALNSIRRLTDCVAAEALQLCFSSRSSGSVSSLGALTKLRLWQTHGTTSDSASCSHHLSYSTTTSHISHEPHQHPAFHGMSTLTAPSPSILQSPLVRTFSTGPRRACIPHTVQRSSNTQLSFFPSSYTISALSFSTSSKDQSATPVPASEGGAASNPWINTPNLLSMGRAVSGPVIAYLIMEDQWAIAITALAVSGVSQT